MLQATPHAIHFNRVLNLDEEQQEGGRYVIDFKADQNFGERQVIVDHEVRIYEN